jgi:hypothetical protein
MNPDFERTDNPIESIEDSRRMLGIDPINNNTDNKPACECEQGAGTCKPQYIRSFYEGYPVDVEQGRTQSILEYAAAAYPARLLYGSTDDGR